LYLAKILFEAFAAARMRDSVDVAQIAKETSGRKIDAAETAPPLPEANEIE
jgi:hypothetical protein